MTILQAILLGLIHGVTALLPLGGSGPVVLVSHFLGTGEAVSLNYLAFLQLGTLAAIVLRFRKEMRGLLKAVPYLCRGLLANLLTLLANLRHPEEGNYAFLLGKPYRKLCAMLTVSMVPTVVIGLLLRRLAAEGAGNLLVCAAGFFLTALLLIISSYTVASSKKTAGTRITDALLIGALQGVSVLPGTGRMGMVLSGGSFAGFSRKYMIKYAFLLGVPSIIAAVVLLIPSSPAAFGTAGAFAKALLGACFSGTASYLLSGRLMRLISRRSNRFFACCALAAGIISAAAYFR